MRATALGVDTVTLLPGGSASGAFGTRTLCSVRTADFSASPAAFLVNIAGFQSFSPTPNSVIPDTAAFQATFTEPVSGIGPNNFTVTGSDSGPMFTDTTYAGNGTNTITTPRGNFLAGEQIEIAMTGPCPQPHLARYSVQAQGSGTFVAGPNSPHQLSMDAHGVAIADLTGNDTLDVVVIGTDGRRRHDGPPTARAAPFSCQRGR